MSEKRTKRRAPTGAYAITRRKNGKYDQYFLTVPMHVAAPLYDADLALTFEVVEDGIMLRPVPMQQSVGDMPSHSAARALVERITGNTRTDGGEA